MLEINESQTEIYHDKKTVMGYNFHRPSIYPYTF